MFDYKELKKKKVAFLCVENACRSQIAEAMANKLCSKCNLEFLSGGTKPADRVNSMVLKVLKEEGINWQGKPKSIYSEEFTNIDIIVSMGCEVECPIIPGARVINWEIPDPKGKGSRRISKNFRYYKKEGSITNSLISNRFAWI